MRKVTVFNQITADGYFTSKDGDMSWAHKHDPEWNAFSAENASGGGLLLFGRVTYEMMASFWPTPEAAKANPEVAERINSLPKVVFSRSLERASWNNTKLVKGSPVEEVARLKKESGPNIVIMGSGTIVSQLTDARLIDEFQIVVNALVLGDGRTMFDGIKKPLTLALDKTRSFKNGNVVLWYRAAG